jgi:hypothetical protein
MADAVLAASGGKGKRVVGTFVLMIGAGIILDARAVWLGLPLMAGGGAALLWGLIDLRMRTPVHAPLGETTETRP